MRRREFFWCLYNKVEKKQLDDLRTDQIEAIYNALPARSHVNYLIWKEGFLEWKLFEEFPQILISLRSSSDIMAAIPNPELPPNPEPVENFDIRKLEDPLDSPLEGVPQVPEFSPADTVLSGVVDIGTAVTKGKKGGAAALNVFPPGQKVSANTITGSVHLSRADSKKVATDENGKPLVLDDQPRRDDRGNKRYRKVFDVLILYSGNIFKTTTVDISSAGLKVENKLPKVLPKYFNVELKYRNILVPIVCSEVKGMDGSPTGRLKIEVNDHASLFKAMLAAS